MLTAPKQPQSKKISSEANPSRQHLTLQACITVTVRSTHSTTLRTSSSSIHSFALRVAGTTNHHFRKPAFEIGFALPSHSSFLTACSTPSTARTQSMLWYSWDCDFSISKRKTTFLPSTGCSFFTHWQKYRAHRLAPPQDGWQPFHFCQASYVSDPFASPTSGQSHL